jgi:gluconolactonase
MFATPLSLTTETLHELPSFLHESDATNAWAHVYAAGRDLHSFLDAPIMDPTGNLWVADAPFGRIFRITPTGEWDLITRYDGWPAGLRFHRDGRLFIADQRHGILEFDVSLRKLTPAVTHAVGQRFLGVGHIVFDDDGGLYFSDAGQSGLHQANGALYRLRADGTLDCLVRGIPGPAGLALSADRQTVMMAVAGDNAVWRVPLLDDGVARVSRHIGLTGGAGVGGIAIDYDDNLYVTHRGLGAVWAFDKRGEVRYRVDSSRGDWTTGVAFDPHDPRNLLITEAQTGVVLKGSLPLY